MQADIKYISIPLQKEIHQYEIIANSDNSFILKDKESYDKLLNSIKIYLQKELPTSSTLSENLEKIEETHDKEDQEFIELENIEKSIDKADQELIEQASDKTSFKKAKNPRKKNRKKSKLVDVTNNENQKEKTESTQNTQSTIESHNPWIRVNQQNGVYYGQVKGKEKHGEGKLIKKIGGYEEIWEGQWKNDELHGKAYFKSNQEEYTGHFSQGLYNGYGEIEYASGATYKGEFCQGKFHGFGEYIDEQFWYKGGFRMGTKHGKGEFKNEKGDFYNGKFLQGKKHGFGEMKYINGMSYKGDWEDDVRQGIGETVYKGGRKLAGKWAEDMFVGDFVEEGLVI